MMGAKELPGERDRRQAACKDVDRAVSILHDMKRALRAGDSGAVRDYSRMAQELLRMIVNDQGNF